MLVRIRIYSLNQFGEVDEIINANVDYSIDKLTTRQIKIIKNIIQRDENYGIVVNELDEYMKSIGAKALVFDHVISNIHKGERNHAK